LCGALTGPIANLNGVAISEPEIGWEITTAAATPINAAHKMPVAEHRAISGGLSAHPRRAMRSSHIVTKLGGAGDDLDLSSTHPMVNPRVFYGLFGRIDRRVQRTCGTDKYHKSNRRRSHLPHVLTHRRLHPGTTTLGENDIANRSISPRFLI
jgi:hypothetical protein